MAKVAAITGASSGIGAATARALANEGYRVVLGARRLERLEALAAELGGEAVALDVTDAGSMEAFTSSLPHCDVLVNNAGGALGLDPVADADEEQWRWMYEANVLGTMRMTRALLPALEESGNGHIVAVTSIAAFEAYRGGAGYVAAKHGQRAMLRALRLELLGQPVRVTEIAPGMVETEFSVVRFGGDEEAAPTRRASIVESGFRGRRCVRSREGPRQLATSVEARVRPSSTRSTRRRGIHPRRLPLRGTCSALSRWACRRRSRNRTSAGQSGSGHRFP